MSALPENKPGSVLTPEHLFLFQVKSNHNNISDRIFPIPEPTTRIVVRGSQTASRRFHIADGLTPELKSAENSWCVIKHFPQKIVFPVNGPNGPAYTRRVSIPQTAPPLNTLALVQLHGLANQFRRLPICFFRMLLKSFVNRLRYINCNGFHMYKTYVF